MGVPLESDGPHVLAKLDGSNNYRDRKSIDFDRVGSEHNLNYDLNKALSFQKFLVQNGLPESDAHIKAIELASVVIDWSKFDKEHGLTI